MRCIFSLPAGACARSVLRSAGLIIFGAIWIFFSSFTQWRFRRPLQHASRLAVHEVDALNLLAQMRVRQNRLADACRAQKKRAVARQPDALRQHICSRTF